MMYQNMNCYSNLICKIIVTIYRQNYPRIISCTALNRMISCSDFCPAISDIAVTIIIYLRIYQALGLGGTETPRLVTFQTNSLPSEAQKRK